MHNSFRLPCAALPFSALTVPTLLLLSANYFSAHLLFSYCAISVFMCTCKHRLSRMTMTQQKYHIWDKLEMILEKNADKFLQIYVLSCTYSISTK